MKVGITRGNGNKKREFRFAIIFDIAASYVAEKRRPWRDRGFSRSPGNFIHAIANKRARCSLQHFHNCDVAWRQSSPVIRAALLGTRYRLDLHERRAMRDQSRISSTLSVVAQHLRSDVPFSVARTGSRDGNGGGNEASAPNKLPNEHIFLQPMQGNKKWRKCGRHRRRYRYSETFPAASHSIHGCRNARMRVGKYASMKYASERWACDMAGDHRAKRIEANRRANVFQRPQRDLWTLAFWRRLSRRLRRAWKFLLRMRGWAARAIARSLRRRMYVKWNNSCQDSAPSRAASIGEHERIALARISARIRCHRMSVSGVSVALAHAIKRDKTQEKQAHVVPLAWRVSTIASPATWQWQWKKKRLLDLDVPFGYRIWRPPTRQVSAR